MRHAIRPFVVTAKMSSVPWLVVLSVSSGTVELQSSSDDLLDGAQEVLFAGNLSPGTDGEHSRFSGNTPELGTGRVGAQPTDELPPDVALDAHTLGMDTEDVCSSFHVGKRELYLSVDSTGTH